MLGLSVVVMKNIRFKVKPLPRTPEKRYYDMRLLWFSLILISTYIGIRWLLSIKYDVPFINVWTKKPGGTWGVDSSDSNNMNNFLGCLMMLEMFVGPLFFVFMVNEKPHVKAKYGYPNPLCWMFFLIMIFPMLLAWGNLYVWIAGIIAMLALSYYIGRYVGFGYPFGKEQVKTGLDNVEDVDGWASHHRIYIPKHAVIPTGIVLLSFSIGLLIYFYCKI